LTIQTVELKMFNQNPITMKKKNLYKKTCLSIAILLGISIPVLSQNLDTEYDRYLARRDTNIKVTDRNPFKVSDTLKADSVVWIFDANGKEVIIPGREMTYDNVRDMGKGGDVYVLRNNIWTRNSFYPCGINSPSCIVNDLLVVNGLTYTVSSKYPDADASWSVAGAWVRNPTISSLVIESMTVEKTYLVVYARSNGIEYTQKMDVNGIIYDSSTTGSLQCPIVSNATYQWYRNGNLITNAKDAFYKPTETGTYTVIITWTDVNARFANARTEEDVVRTATFTFNVTKIANPTGIEDETSSSNLITLFPNPTTDHFYINTIGDFTYRIENASSNNVLSGNGNNITQINVNGLNTGLYFVYVNSSNKQTIQKLIIK